MARRACAAGAFAGELAITSCEFGAVEAHVFDSSLATRKMRRAAAEREEDGNESADAGQSEENEVEENEQRPRSSFSGFSGVVPTQTTAPAREPRVRLNGRLSVHLRAKK